MLQSKKGMVPPPELKNIDNIISEEPSTQEDKFEMFNKWCRDQGIYLPKLEYPAFFEGGLIGLKCTADINHREAFAYVPYKLLMTVGKAMSHPIIGHIIS